MDSKVEQLLSRTDSLLANFIQDSQSQYIDEAIALGREALDLCILSHPMRSSCLIQLALCLRTWYDQLGGTEHLNEAIALGREAQTLCPPGHPDRSSTLDNLAVSLWTRYKHLGGVEDLNEALALHRDALVLCPPGHPDRSMSLINLSLGLSDRYEQLGEMEDLNEALDLDREALALCPPGDPRRSTALNNFATDLHERYRQLGGVDDLNEVLALHRDALVLRSPGHPDRSISLSNLAVCLYEREALALCPPGHSLRSTALNNLAIHLDGRYKQLGGVDDLNEAISLHRDAIVLRPPGRTDRSLSLVNLTVCLYDRYERLGRMEDLSAALDLGREALALCPPGHSLRSTALNNLAAHLRGRYKQLGGVDELNEALSLLRDALVLHSPGHPDRSMSLINLAASLYIRYERLGGIEDVNEALDLNREALALCPPGHSHRSIALNNLTMQLLHKQLGGVDDPNEALSLHRDVLVPGPPGLPDRSTSLTNLNLTASLSARQPGDPEDQEEIFRLYTSLAHGTQTVSLSDLEAAKAWVNVAENLSHPTTLLAYGTALRFLVHHLASLPSLPQHLALLKSLSSSLAVDAFSACLRNQSPANAVEFLEQGRGVFWSQLTRLRSPLEDVIASGPEGKTLADQFTRLTTLIRNALDSPGADQHDRVWHLNIELQRVVSNIRELPGLSRFLLPSPFSDLQCAASCGPVIIVNASKYSCDALVVTVDRDPIHIPLSITKEEVRKLSSTLRTLTFRAKKSDATREFGITLRELWDRVVSPIVYFLRTICPLQSRIWWCPTAEFSLLPLHAAGPYRKRERNLSGLYISSYTPTVTALIRARRPSSPTRNPATQKYFIGIGQANAVGTSQLASVGTELANIGHQVDHIAIFTRIEGQESCISRVTDELGKNEWVHLACHGLPNQKKPFESAFALQDGHLTIQRIIQCDLTNPEFVYLSACHTTVEDEESPDEVIHLASAMLFAGFRSVIGTMWAVDDAETNKITSVFYKYMLDGAGSLDYTRAAYALRSTMRTVNIPFDQRILYVHIGA